MKNALLLHGTDASSASNWFPWLRRELIEKGYDVWVPDLPHAEKPNIQRYNKFIFAHGFVFTSSSVLIGHSSGAVAILGLLEALPNDIQVDTCILVGSFRNDLGWESLKELFIKPFDFKKIKSRARKFIFIHSDNDPYCPLEHAAYLSAQLHGTLLVKHGEAHFSGNHVTIPEILELLKV